MRFLKNLFLGFLLFVVAGTTSSLEATHLMGADITYECLSNCVIRIHLRAYRDCSGASGISTQTWNFGAPSAGCNVPIPLGNWVPGDGANDWFVTEVTPVCPGTITQCQSSGSSIRGVEEYYRFRDYNICSLNCNSYTIEWAAQARNGGITSGAANQGLGSFLTTLNPSIQPCNSSPQFNNAPVPYICQGQSFTFNQGASDPDGDSLSYELGPCFTETGGSINYNAGYSATSPLGTSWGVTVNPTTGDVTFNPQPGNIEVGVMCIYVREWRNGILINTVSRDIQINVIPCPLNVLPVVNTVTNPSGGVATGGSATGVTAATCAGNNLCFDIPITDGNAGDTITVWWDQSLPGGQFFETGNPTNVDTIVGPNPNITFCWTPPAPGQYSFLVTMQDDACPSFGSAQFTVSILVSDPMVAAIPSPLRCDTIDLCAMPTNGIPPYSYQWVGQGGISGTDSCITNTFSAPGTYTYDLIVTDSLGCMFTYSDSVTITQIPTADAGPDILGCETVMDTIGGPPTPNETYSWIPTTGLSDPTLSNPVVTLTNPGPGLLTQTYVVFALDTLTGCETNDTVVVEVSFPAVVDMDSTPVSCFAGADGTIDLTVTGGLAPILVAWTGPNGYTSNSQDITGLEAGTYVVAVLDAAGCLTVDSIEVIQPSVPLWTNIQRTNVTCNGDANGAADLTVTGGTAPYTYQWSLPAVTEDISMLPPGVYTVTVTDSNGCVIVDSTTITEPAPITVGFNSYPVACAGESNGILAADVNGGNGNYGLLWLTVGSTQDSITGLDVGAYPILVTDTAFGDTLTSLFYEDFDGNAPWILNVLTGANGADNNFWTISDDEGGVLPPGCATSANADATLHITSSSNPTGGAVYNTGGNCGVGPCPETNLRAESPQISTVGYTNLTLTFDFMSQGDALLDNASFWYNSGAGWQQLLPTIKSTNCGIGQGQWAALTAPLPASCENIADLQIGFNWTNNDDGAGNQPSVAINNVRIVAPQMQMPTICSFLDTGFVNEPLPLSVTMGSTSNLCAGDSNGVATATAAGGNGNYGYNWSEGSIGPVVAGLAAGTYTVTVTDTAYTPAGGANGYLLCSIIETVIIDEPVPLSLSTSSTPTLCFLSSDGTASVTAAGGTGTYTYQWSTIPVQTGPTAVGLPTGAYSVTVTDQNGCQDSASVVVSQPSPVAASATMTNSTCGDPNGTATVTGSGGVGGYTYAWNTTPVQTTATAINLLAGPYVVIVTDANGCQTSAAITVGNEPNPVVSIDNQTDVSCWYDSDGTASASATGGTGPYNFQWSNGQTGPNATGLSPISYSVTVTDNFGCRDTADVTILSPPEITDTLIVQDMFCMSTSGDGSIGVIASGGTPGYTYEWSTVPPQTTQNATGLDPGVYFVTITDQNGCILVDNDTVVQIPRPTVTVGPNTSFCEGEGGAQIFAQASGGAAPYSYVWFCDTTNTYCGLDSIFDNDPIANPDTSTCYFVYVVDANGCLSDTQTVCVDVLPKPIVDAGPDIFLCGDQAPCEVLNPTISGAAGPYSYLWMPSTGLNNDTILNPCARPDTTTIYTLVVTAGNGCSSELTTTDTLSSITVHVNPVPVADAGPDRDICLGDSAILQGVGSGAGPAYQFEWSPADGLSDTVIANPWAYPNITTEYTLVVWSNGCPSYADTVEVDVHTIPTATINWDQEICLGDSTLLDAQASADFGDSFTYQWSPTNGLSDSTTEDVWASPDTTTTYSVIAVSNWGCESDPEMATVYLKSSPIAQAGPNLNLCDGDSIQLQGSYSFTTTLPAPANQVYLSWSPANEMDDSTIATPTVWPSQSGWYYLEVRHNTCSTMDSTLVEVNPQPIAMVSADTTTICGGDGVQLYSDGGIGGASYSWTPAEGLDDPAIANPIATPEGTTTYSVLIEEGTCFDTASITVNVIPNPTPAYLSSLTEGCTPHTVSFTQVATNSINYVWDFGDGSPVSNEDFPTHVYEEPGSYTVTLTTINSGGCEASVNDILVQVADTIAVDFVSTPTHPIELSLPDTRVEFRSEVPTAPGHVWDFGDGNGSEEVNPSYAFTDPGTYFVSLLVQNEFGCVSRVMHGPYIVFAPDLFIPNVFSPNADGINDRFLVEYTGSQSFDLTIFDRWGVQLYQARDKNEGWNGTDVNGEAVPDGTYYYHVKVRDKKYVGQVSLVR